MLHVAVVGLGFGRSFVPIYQAHPLVRRVTVFDSNLALRSEFPSCEWADSFEAILNNADIDAVHLLTPLPTHAELTLQILKAGKHCACAVTMGNTLEELRTVVQAAEGLRYMMMETGVYTREFLFARDVHRRGDFGDLTLLRGDYFQDLEAPYPDYWRQVPPMHYATHCTGPIFELAGTCPTHVSCVGASVLRKDICDSPGNPFPLEVATFRLEGSSALAQVTRAWYQSARQYVESFSVYGDQRGFEWQQLEHENPVMFELAPVQNEHRWRDCKGVRTAIPFRPDLLPEPIQVFADGGHGGSHPHLVHEFVSSIVYDREPLVGARKAASWCAAGIVAHQSALQNGAWLEIPKF